MTRRAPQPSLFWLTGLLLVGWMGCAPADSDTIDASFIHLPGESDDAQAPRMSWNATHMDLGLLAAGEQRHLTYTVTNAGGAPMLIAQVLPSCGCTVADAWDEGPIAPGESRDIVLHVKAGETTTTLAESATVVTNAVPASIELTFTADVLGPDRAEPLQP